MEVATDEKEKTKSTTANRRKSCKEQADQTETVEDEVRGGANTTCHNKERTFKKKLLTKTRAAWKATKDFFKRGYNFFKMRHKKKDESEKPVPSTSEQVGGITSTASFGENFDERQNQGWEIRCPGCVYGHIANMADNNVWRVCPKEKRGCPYDLSTAEDKDAINRHMHHSRLRPHLPCSNSSSGSIACKSRDSGCSFREKTDKNIFCDERSTVVMQEGCCYFRLNKSRHEHNERKNQKSAATNMDVKDARKNEQTEECKSFETPPSYYSVADEKLSALIIEESSAPSLVYDLEQNIDFNPKSDENQSTVSLASSLNSQQSYSVRRDRVRRRVRFLESCQISTKRFLFPRCPNSNYFCDYDQRQLENAMFDAGIMRWNFEHPWMAGPRKFVLVNVVGMRKDILYLELFMNIKEKNCQNNDFSRRFRHIFGNSF